MAAKGIRAGRAFVELFADDSRLRRTLDQTGKRLRSFGASVAKIGAGIGAAGAAISAPFVVATKRFAEYGDRLAQVSARTGESVSALSELGFAAQQSGTDVETFQEGLTEMVQRLGEAKSGAGSALDGLRMIGLEAGKLADMSPGDAFAAIADGINQLPTQSDRIFAIDEIFGGDGREMISMIQQGSEGLAAFRKQAQMAGVTIGGETAARAAELKASMGVLGQQFTAVAMQLADALAPAITRISEIMSQVVSDVIAFIRENKGLVQIVAGVAAGLIAAGAAVAAIGATMIVAGIAVSGLASAIGLLVSVIGALLSPVGLAIAAIVSIGAAIVHMTGVGSKALDWLGEQFARLRDIVGPILQGIQAALMSGDFGEAAGIAWDGIVAAFLTGRAWVLEIWYGLTDKLMQAWNEVWNGMQLLVIESLSKIVGGIIDAYSKVFGWLADQLDSDFLRDMQANVEVVGDEADDFFNRRRKGVAERLGAAEEARRARLRDGLDRAQEDRTEAADLLAQALEASARAQVERDEGSRPAGGAPQAPQMPDFQDIQEQTSRAIGSFSARALSRSFASAGDAIARKQGEDVSRIRDEVREINDTLPALLSGVGPTFA